MALLLLAGCFAAPEGAGGSAAEDAPQQRWRAAGLQDYRYDFQQQCFCVREQVQPVTIEVRDGRIHRVLSRETGQEITASEGLRWPTVPDLFRLVAEARENGTEPRVVRYDPQLGYPAYIEIGTLANDAGVIYSASNLHSINAARTPGRANPALEASR